MKGAKEYLPLMLCWANCFFLFLLQDLLLHPPPWLCALQILLKSLRIFPFLSESLGWETEQSFSQVVPARGTGEKAGFRAGEMGLLLLMPPARRRGWDSGACPVCMLSPRLPRRQRSHSCLAALGNSILAWCQGINHLLSVCLLFIVIFFSILPPSRCAKWKCLQGFVFFLLV